MNSLLESLTKSLTEQGWKVEMQENTQIPTEIAQRYDSLPTDYIYFLRNMKACVNSAETVWMLCPDDFAPQGENGFESLSDPELELVLARAMPALKQGAFDGIFSPEERMTALLCRVFAKDPPPRRPRLISCNHTPEYFAGLFPRPASIDLGPRMLAELALRELMRRISGEEPRADHVAVIVTPQLVPGE